MNLPVSRQQGAGISITANKVVPPRSTGEQARLRRTEAAHIPFRSPLQSLKSLRIAVLLRKDVAILSVAHDVADQRVHRMEGDLIESGASVSLCGVGDAWWVPCWSRRATRASTTMDSVSSGRGESVPRVRRGRWRLAGARTGRRAFLDPAPTTTSKSVHTWLGVCRHHILRSRITQS